LSSGKRSNRWTNHPSTINLPQFDIELN